MKEEKKHFDAVLVDENDETCLGPCIRFNDHPLFHHQKNKISLHAGCNSVLEAFKPASKA